MRRAIWFVAGAGAGVYAMTKARRLAEAFTPEGLEDRLAGLAVGAHLFNEEIRTGMAEKEKELRGRLDLELDEGGDATDMGRLANGRHLALTRKGTD